MPLAPINIFDKPGIMTARLLEGDIGAAARTPFQASTLSAEERKSLVTSLIGEKAASSTYGKVLSVVTNPFVLIGAVLAIRYPVLSARNMMRLKTSLGGYDRYVNPISRWIGSLDDTFKGTKIPDLFRGLARNLHSFLDRALGEGTMGLTTLLRRYQTTAGKELSQAAGTRVFMKLDGLDVMTKGAPGYILSKQLNLPYIVKPIKLSGAEQALYNTLRKDWLPQHFETIEKAGVAGMTTLRETGLVMTAMEAKAGLKHITHYAPHMISRSSRMAEDALRMELKGTAVSRKTAHKIRTVHAKDRHNAMLPSREEMELMDAATPGQLHPQFRGNLEREIGRRSTRFDLDPDKYPAPREYTMNLVPTLEKYSNSVSRVNAWHATGLGKSIEKELLVAQAAGPHGYRKAQMLRDVYIPMAKGHRTQKESIKAANWASDKLGAIEKLSSPAMKKWVPESWRKKLIGMLQSSPTLESQGSLGSSMASVFYLGALGGNLRFAFANLTQSGLTASMIGTKWTGRGMASVLKGGEKYFGLRSKGSTAESALSKAFPEFHKAGATNLSSIFEGLGPELDQIWTRGLSATRGKGLPGKFKDALMSLMTGTEKFNRLTAFEGARLKALSEGLRGSPVLDFASTIMERSQFTPTLTGTPKALLGVNPVLKQFTTFGVKYATRLAGGVTGVLRGDPERAGELGRLMMGSAVAYESFKHFADTDISNVLMFGALPAPRSDSPLGVLPFAPPIISLGAAAVQSVLDEDLAPLKQQLPILVPGGVAGARAVAGIGGRVLPQTVVRGVSEFIGKQYVDYSTPDESGRYPLYNRSGKLIDHYTGAQLLMKASGLPVGDLQKEGEMMGFLLKQREGMRVTKRAWLNAYRGNDEPAQRDIAQQYRQQFGIDIPIKRSDIERIELQRTVPRLQTLLKTLPKESRGQFGAVVGIAVGAQAEGLFGGQ